MPLAHSHPLRQDLSPSTSPSPTTPSFSSKLYYGTNIISKNNYPSTQQPSLDWDYPTPSYYIDTRQSTPSELVNYNFADSQYMQTGPAQYPEVRVQQTTPNQALPSATPPPLLTDDTDYTSVPWSHQDPSYLAPNIQQQYTPTSYRSHRRLPSESSVGSPGPDSPYTSCSNYPHIVDPDSQPAHLDSFDGSYLSVPQYPKSNFGTPAQNSDQLFYPHFENFSLVGDNATSMMTAQTGTRNVISQHCAPTMNGGQNTSRGSFGNECDSSLAGTRNNIPHLDRTKSDIYQDLLLNPEMASPAPLSQSRPLVNTQRNVLSPQMSALNDILREANNGHLSARSASPVVGVASRRSPFRDTSEFAAAGFYSNPNSPAPRLNSAAQRREQLKLEADAQVFAQRHQSSRDDLMSTPKTISPKEAVLDYTESEEYSKLPLFPPAKQEPGIQQASMTYDQPLPRLATETSNDQSFSSMATSRRQSSSTYSTSPAPPTSGSNFQFMPPSVPAMPQQYPFISQSRRQSSSMRSGSDQVPEFPASLTSMESTKSEAGQAEHVRLIPESSPPSSQEAPVQRPIDTSANSGSYTCTGSDCHARFDTAAKLQKHRRENHRSSPSASTTPTTPSSATTLQNQQAAANNVSRNNQPGPHKCERVNPSTGKPCNTVFSRSYDLTRHEDTIHSNRKQKVRCHLCTEEKTFSRNDALTRHMRVVHPDVDFPGKTRRGRNNEGMDVVRQRIESGRGGR